MAQTETIGEIIAKKGSIEHLWAIIDPKNKYPYRICIKEWYRMDLNEQRKMYLYLLYKKWRGDKFYGTPYDIITNCHPYPTNWNFKKMGADLLKSKTKMVSAFFNGSFGLYTFDEAKVWCMTHIEPRN